MKIRLNVSDERYSELEEKLVSAGFIIDDEAELIITEKERYASYIAAKNKKGEKKRVKAVDIVYIESCGHDVIIHASDGETYYAYDRLYQLCNILDNKEFIRVSNCAIIAKKHLKKIKSTISMKFILIMSDGALVDVTRSYYNSFKEFFGF